MSGWVNEGGYFGDSNTRPEGQEEPDARQLSLGRNEAGYDIEWITTKRRAMDAAGFADVKVVVVADDLGGTPALMSR